MQSAITACAAEIVAARDACPKRDTKSRTSEVSNQPDAPSSEAMPKSK